MKSLTGYVSLEDCTVKQQSCTATCSEKTQLCVDACKAKPEDAECASKCEVAARACNEMCDDVFNSCKSKIKADSGTERVEEKLKTGEAKDEQRQEKSQQQAVDICKKKYGVDDGSQFCKNKQQAVCIKGKLEPKSIKKCSAGCDDEGKSCKQETCKSKFNLNEGEKLCEISKNQKTASLVECKINERGVPAKSTLQACTFGCSDDKKSCKEEPKKEESKKIEDKKEKKELSQREPIIDEKSESILAENEAPTISSFKIAATKQEVGISSTFKDEEIDFCYKIEAKDDKAIAKIEFFAATKGGKSVKVFTFNCQNKEKCVAAGCRKATQVQQMKLAEGFSAKDYSFIVYDVENQKIEQEFSPAVEVKEELVKIEEKKEEPVKVEEEKESQKELIPVESTESDGSIVSQSSFNTEVYTVKSTYKVNGYTQ